MAPGSLCRFLMWACVCLKNAAPAVCPLFQMASEMSRYNPLILPLHLLAFNNVLTDLKSSCIMFVSYLGRRGFNVAC